MHVYTVSSSPFLPSGAMSTAARIWLLVGCCGLMDIYCTDFTSHPTKRKKRQRYFVTSLIPTRLRLASQECILLVHVQYIHVYMYLASHTHTYTQPCRAVSLSCQLPESAQTLQLMSDGLYVYWLYYQRTQDSVTHPVSGEKVKQFPVFIHQLQVHVLGCWLLVRLVVQLYT